MLHNKGTQLRLSVVPARSTPCTFSVARQDQKHIAKHLNTLAPERHAQHLHEHARKHITNVLSFASAPHTL
eukprot:11847086-Prorocentrum_lima.AAC.1